MRNKRYKIKQGEAFSIAFFHMGLPVIDGEKYEITEKDILTFTIRRRNRKPVLIKTFPGEIDKEGDDSFFVHLTAEDTETLPCLCYRMQLAINLEGLGDEVYTLVNKEMEVVAK